MSGRECKTEFGLQLFAPLADQRSRREHQHALGHAAQRIFLEHHAGLDRLAEPDLIGKQNAATELLEHLAHRFDLMQQRLDAGEMRQAQELVEALRQAEMGEPFAQAEPAAILLGPMHPRRDQRREIELDRNGMSISICGNGGGSAGDSLGVGAGTACLTRTAFRVCCFGFFLFLPGFGHSRRG